MGRWLRKLRGIVGVGALGGLTGAIAGALWPVVSHALRGELAPWYPIARYAIAFGLFGAFASVVFGSLLALTERHESVSELSLVKCSLWGAAAGALFPAFFVLLRDGSLASIALEPMLLAAGFFAGLGAVLSGSMIAIARSGAGRELEAPASAPALPQEP